MEDLYFTNKNKFNAYLKSATKFSKQGVEGTVYHKDNLVIKDFGIKPIIDTSHILQFRDLNLEDFFFPQAGIYIRIKLRACIMHYAPGLSLYERDVLIEDVNVILEAIKRLEDAIKEASKIKIRLSDVNLGNVLFDTDHFNFIDTSDYYYSPLEYEDLLALNMQHVMHNIYKKILPLELYRFQLRSKGADAMYNFPHECLEELFVFLERLLGQFQSFGDAGKMIKEQKIILPK